MDDPPAAPPRTSLRTIIFSQVLPVFAPAAMILGAIWAASGWTTGIENKAGRIEDRVTVIEKKTEGSTAHETRIGQLEFRLNWMDEEKNRDRNERRQIDRDIREALDRLNNVVIRLEANDPYKRRR